MLHISESADEVIVCEVNREGQPIGREEFFKEGTGRDEEEYNVKLVEGPLHITFDTRVRVDAERDLTQT